MHWTSLESNTVERFNAMYHSKNIIVPRVMVLKIRYISVPESINYFCKSVETNKSSKALLHDSVLSKSIKRLWLHVKYTHFERHWCKILEHN